MRCRTWVRCAPAEPAHHEKARRRRSWRRAAGITVVVTALLATGCSRESELSPPDAVGAAAQTHEAQAVRAVRSLAGAISLRDGAALSRLESDAGDGLGYLVANAEALQVDQFEARYVGPGPEPTAEDRLDHGEDALVAVVALTYQLAGVDQAPVHLDVAVVLVPDGDSVRIGGFGGYGERTPLWLAGPVQVVRESRATLIAAGSLTPERQRWLGGLAAQAVTQVSRLLRDWEGPLVVEAPGGREALDEALRAAPGQFDRIAAVTTTVDGSLVPGSPVHVFLNPEIFKTLRPRGAQVVMTHEAVHVATDATFTSLPEWLSEGFADFVALDDAGVPVRVAAAQVLKRVRREGAPPRLPTSQDLEPTAQGLGATYEEAWLACRFMAQRYGAARTVEFYQAVSAGAGVAQTFRVVLGTTQARFVREWRADVARLAQQSG